ncbi:MAG: hypothetical protein ABSB68_08830 [Acidimicrobiales bacterium]|jgi:hypothetical protein
MVVFTAGYLALSAAKIAHHQMWRDELQPWSLARSSSSLGQLISRVRYEQHSPGWYVLLWVVSRFTSSPEAVQVLLFVLVVVTVIYVVWVAPFPLPLRFCLLFGYFLLFEYSTIGRPYILNFLLGVIGAEFVRRRRFSGWFALTLVGLVLFDDAFGTIIAIALISASFVRVSRGPAHQVERRQVVGAAVSTVLAQVLVLALSKAPANYGGPTLQLAHLFHLSSIQGHRALEQPFNAFFPLPNSDVQFWNTFVVDNLASGLVILLSLAAVAVITWALRSDRSAQVLWLVTVVMTVAFLDAGNETSSRFVGTIFVGVVAAFWIHPDVRLARPQSALMVILTVVLVLQIPGGIVAVTISASHPFSQAENAAAVVRDLRGTVVASPDYSATPVSVYANRPLYLAQTGRLGTYTVWNNKMICIRTQCLYSVLAPQAITHAMSFARAGPTYLLLDFPLQNRVPRTTLCRAFTGAIDPTEDYWLYSVDHAPCPA